MTKAGPVSLASWRANHEREEPREEIQTTPVSPGIYDELTPQGQIMKPGDRLGSFEVLSLLGAGGMGEVYEARDLRLDRRVAIKVLSERLSADVKARSAFEREARAVASLSHPNILSIHEFNHQGDVAYAVTELLEGETLRRMLASRRFSWRKASEITIAICDGLIAAHAKGVVHRDLKPENVFVTSAGVVKILDFGLAALSSARPAGSAERTETAPSTGGTIGYMAPEQLRGEEVDVRADLFSVGCMLYEMLTGVAPFVRPTRVEMVAAALRDDPEPLRIRASDAPQSLITTVERCLEKRKEDRFQSARDLRFALASSLAEADRAGRVSKGQRRVVAAITAAVLVILATVAVIGRGGGGPPKDPHIKRIVMLPFADLSGKDEDAYFSEGMTDAVIANLAQIGSLDVISRTTAMQYATRDKSIPVIAEELGVDAVIEGAFLRSAGRIRVTTQLIDPGKDRQIWSRTYERESRDILQLQSELARDIASEIDAQLTPEESDRLTQAKPVDPRVYDVYLKGVLEGREWNWKRAVVYYQQAIEMDPGFAPAHAGLATTYATLFFFEDELPEGIEDVARAAAQRAILLSPTAPEGHLAAANVALMFDWDFEGMRRSLERAVTLAPGHAEAHSLYGEYWLSVGSPDRALAEFRRAFELDPQSGNVLVKVASTCYALGDYDCALESARRADELPGFFFHQEAAREVIALVLARRGRLEEALTLVSSHLNEDNRNLAFHRVYSLAGRTAEASHYLDLVRKSPNEDKSISAAALAGDVDTVIEFLEPLVTQRRAAALGVLDPEFDNDPAYEALRADPRFRALVAKVRRGRVEVKTNDVDRRNP